MFKEIVDDHKIGRSQKLTMSTLCSGELKSTLGKKNLVDIHSDGVDLSFQEPETFNNSFEDDGDSDSFNSLSNENINSAYTTRTGRRVKPKQIFSPS